MKNKYYLVAIWGIVITFVLQVILAIAVDPYLAAVLSPFYSVWVILLVVAWRNQHPRR